MTAAPLSGLAGSGLAGRFRHWRGRGGRRYLFSVFPVRAPAAIDDMPRFEDAVVLAVATQRDGAGHILYAGETGPLPELVMSSADLHAAVERGADEIHVHLLADTAEARAALLDDLERAVGSAV